MVAVRLALLGVITAIAAIILLGGISQALGL
jgi:hypothetical protein